MWGLRTIRLVSQIQPSRNILQFIPLRSLLGGLSSSSISRISDEDTQHQKSNGPLINPSTQINKYLMPVNSTHDRLNNNLSGVGKLEESFQVFSQLKKENDGFFKPPDIEIYVAIIRILCYWGMDMRLDSLLLEFILSKDEHLGFQPSEFTRKLEYELCIREGSYDLFAGVVESLVKAFVSLGRFDDALDTLLSTGKSCVLLKSFNFLMDRLVEGGEFDLALQLLQEMERNGMKTDDITYNNVLAGAAAVLTENDLDIREDCFRDRAEEADRYRADCNMARGARNTFIFENKDIGSRNKVEEILKALVVAKGSVSVNENLKGGEFLEEALQVFKQLQRSEADGFFKSPDLATYVAIIRILCYWRMDTRLNSLLLEVIKSPDTSHLFLVLERRLKVKEEWEGSNYLLAQALDALVKAYVSMGMFEEAILNLLLMNTSPFGRLSLLSSCNFLMDELVKCGKVDLAVNYAQIYLNLDEPDNESDDEPKVYAYGILMKALFRKGNFEEAANVFWKMVKAGLAPNVDYTCIYVEELCSYGSPGQAEVVMRKMEKKHGSVADEYCYGALIHGYCEAGDPIKAMDLHSEMRAKNIKINSVISTTILNCLRQSGMFGEALYESKYFQELTSYLGNLVEMKDIVTYTTLINGCCRNGRVSDAIELVKEMERIGMKTNYVLADAL